MPSSVAMVQRLGTAGAIFVATGILLASGPAGAQATTFDVDGECGTEREFRDGLSRLLGSAAERAWPTQLVIAREPASTEYRLTLELQGETRELRHADCRVLFRSALVIAAVTVDPTLRIPDEPAAAPPPPPPPPAAAPEPATPPPRNETQPPGPALRGNVAVGAGVALGVLQGATGTLEVRGGITSGHFGGSVAAQYFLPREASTGGRSADLQGIGMRAAASFLPVPIVAVSVGMSADWLVGRGSAGIASPVQDSAWALAPSLELALTPRLTPSISLELGVAGQVNLLRPSFEVTGFREIYQMPPASLLILARGAFHFP